MWSSFRHAWGRSDLFSQTCFPRAYQEAWHLYVPAKGWWKEWMNGLCWPGICLGRVLGNLDRRLAPESIRKFPGGAKEVLLLWSGSSCLCWRGKGVLTSMVTGERNNTFSQVDAVPKHVATFGSVLVVIFWCLLYYCFLISLLHLFNWIVNFIRAGTSPKSILYSRSLCLSTWPPQLRIGHPRPHQPWNQE